jgi:hypothetical protein
LTLVAMLIPVVARAIHRAWVWLVARRAAARVARGARRAAAAEAAWLAAQAEADRVATEAEAARLDAEAEAEVQAKIQIKAPAGPSSETGG